MRSHIHDSQRLFLPARWQQPIGRLAVWMFLNSVTACPERIDALTQQRAELNALAGAKFGHRLSWCMCSGLPCMPKQPQRLR